MDNIINTVDINVGFQLDKYEIKTVTVEKTEDGVYGTTVSWTVPSGVKLIVVESVPSNVTGYGGYNNVYVVVDGVTTKLTNDRVGVLHYNTGMLWSQLSDSEFRDATITSVLGNASRDSRGSCTARLRIIYAEPK